MIDPGEESTITVGSATVTFPAGAVDEAVEITVTELDPEGVVSEADQVIGPVLRFEPEGTVFDEPVKLRFANTGGVLDGEGIGYYDEITEAWDSLDVVEVDGGLEADLFHFSLYAHREFLSVQTCDLRGPAGALPDDSPPASPTQIGGVGGALWGMRYCVKPEFIAMLLGIDASCTTSAQGFRMDRNGGWFHQRVVGPFTEQSPANPYVAGFDSPRDQRPMPFAFAGACLDVGGTCEQLVSQDPVATVACETTGTDCFCDLSVASLATTNTTWALDASGLDIEGLGSDGVYSTGTRRYNGYPGRLGQQPPRVYGFVSYDFAELSWVPQ